MGPTYHASSMHGSHDVQMAGGLKIVALVLGGVHGLIENQIVYLTACMSVDFLGQLVMFKVCLANLVPVEVTCAKVVEGIWHQWCISQQQIGF